MPSTTNIEPTGHAEMNDGRRRARRCSSRGALAAALLAVPGVVLGQQLPATDTLDPSLEVFFECHGGWRGGGCDQQFFRQEVDYINWMRDPQDADVHVIVTSQGTGGGGYTYTLEFIGRGRYTGQDRQLAYTTDATDTRDENRRGVMRTLELGLVPYLLRTGVARDLDVVYRAPEAGTPEDLTMSPADDPWRGWVFRLSVGGSADGESLTRETSVRGSFSANRTTERWKTSFWASGENDHEEYDVVDETTDTTYVVDEGNYRTGTYSVYSLAEHWSVGGRVAASAASFYNRNLVLEFGPALEYSLFPYAEASRRQLVVFYQITASHIRYKEETIYLKTRETVIQEAIELGYEATQPWGNAGLSLRGSHYMHRPGGSWLYNASARGNLGLRIVRGLQLDVYGRVELIRDQLYIPKEGSSLDDILLQRRQLQTDYEYSIGLNLSFRFGSRFNNVVNPRLEEAF